MFYTGVAKIQTSVLVITLVDLDLPDQEQHCILQMDKKYVAAKYKSVYLLNASH
jgi:hypothetical protein